MAEEETGEAKTTDSFRLDLGKRSMTQNIERDLRSAREAKFVEIVIAEVENPRMIRITFELHYLTGNGERQLLGNFGLFPPDNTGRFIVPAPDEPRAAGALELEMVVLDEVGPDDEVSVEVERMSFRRE